ncbi:MAG: proton-conducting transporter membrane subunit, partial [Candidatus Omnitrophota bacterium]|nr:proton-conducting transporter membrane subunit [Candidatus Omnitrophota bacterium]
FDAISRLILTFISILFFVISLYLIDYLKSHNKRANRFTAGFVLCLLSGMTLVVMSRHMGLLWIAIEATTLFSAPLINFHRSPHSVEATWKYLLICSVGIALALLGTLFLAVAATSVGTVFLGALLKNASLLSIPWLKLSVIFLFVGYGTKMGLAPMHTWLPDAHSEAPSPVSALLSGVLLNCAFLGILRVFQICVAAGQTAFAQDLFLIMGLLSLLVAAIFVIGQADYKRLFAYSSVENMGILALGIGLGGVGLYGSLFHMINNAFAKGMIFLVTGNIYQAYQSKKVKDVKGLLGSYPVTGIFLVMGFLAVTGVPPFGTFYSELMILNAAIQSRHYWVAFFYILFLAVIFMGIAESVLRMLHRGTKGQTTGPAPPMAGPAHKEDLRLILPILFLGAIVLILGFYMPSFLDDALKGSSALLGGR